MQQYETKAENYSLLDKKDKTKTISSADYKAATHQKETLSCWAASHSYVMRMYVKQHLDKFIKNRSKYNLPALPSFHESLFKTIENYKPNPFVEGKIEETKNQKKADINYYKESENIREFLTQNKMGNPFTVADTVITRLPRTAERHVVFALSDYKDLHFDKPEREKLGNYLMKKLKDDIFRTKVPVSLLHAGHYYSVIGVNMEKGYLECFDSRKTGAALKTPVHVAIKDVIASNKFEIIYPEYLDDQNLQSIKEEFGIKENLYDQEGQIIADDELNKIQQTQLDNPVNMMHNYGISFEKKKEKQDEPFEKLFSEEIYMPMNLNLPLIIKNENANRK